MLPQEDYSDVNFIGLIIGPRGHTLKMLEKEVGLFVYFFIKTIFESFRLMQKLLFEVKVL